MKSGFQHPSVSTTSGFKSSLDDSMQMTATWETIFASMKELGSEELKLRQSDLKRYLQENGVTYNIYGDSGAKSREWNLDLLPYLIEAQDWHFLEAGMIQRAQLFSMILNDLYGPQVLIKKGLLPMEIVYEHAGFLRECSGIQQQQLIIYSADLARNSRGEWWIMNDRTQAPSGMGYALENRMAMARIVPEFFNNVKLKRLSPFYNAMHEALVAMSPRTASPPRIVILTPGAGNETFFEHSFLSSHLGYTLVQGDDLMVKDNSVWLKTVGGLEKVDVIVRRVDDLYCDPLELKEDSQLGIPGLLQAIRNGHVIMANPLGSSVIENPGLIPFLPAISRYMLGQDLMLPSIASWWCGQPKELQLVIDQLPRLIIKKIFRSSSQRSSVDASLLTTEQLKELAVKILQTPHLYVAQEKMDYEGAPSYIQGTLNNGPALFRNYVVNNKGKFSVMQGGLTRSSVDETNIVISNQTGGFSKDTWILTDEMETFISSLNSDDRIDLNTVAISSDVLPSRTAENLYWVGRYTERLVGNARFQRTVLQFIEDAINSSLAQAAELKKMLLMALTKHTHCYPGFDNNFNFNDSLLVWKELNQQLFDEGRVSSLSFNLKSFLRGIEAVRDYWSVDSWRVLRDLEENWVQPSENRQKGNYKTLATLDSLITSMMAFININRQSMIRGLGWTLMDAGRKLEQSLQLLSLVDAMSISSSDTLAVQLMMEAVLKTNDNLVSYRFKYRSHINSKLVLQLLLLDQENPRSLFFQLQKLKKHLQKLPMSPLQEFNKVFDLLELMPNDLRQENFKPTLDALRNALYELSDTISKSYFKHAVEQQQLFKQ